MTHAAPADIVWVQTQPYLRIPKNALLREQRSMIYILAALLPPLGLLLNGQPFSAILNLIIIVPCVVFGLLFPLLFLVPSLHAIIAVHMKREDRKHRELVDAIERHGPPPGWHP
jgi:hypothetical protein